MKQSRLICWFVFSCAWAAGPAALAQQHTQRAGDHPKVQLDQIMSDPLYSRWELRQPREEALMPSLIELNLNAVFDAIGEVVKAILDAIFANPQPRAAGASQPRLDIAETMFFIGQVLMVVVAIVIAVMLFLTIRALLAGRRGSRSKAVSIAHALDEGDALAAASSEWVEHARSLADSVDLRLAFRAMYLGLLSGLHESGRIRYRRQRTNWVYVRQFKGEPNERANFANLTDQFDGVWYGHRRPSMDGFERLRREVTALLGDAQS